MSELDSRILFEELEAFFEQKGSTTADGGVLKIDSEKGVGEVSCVQLFKGLELLLFDVALQQPLEFSYKTESDAFIHFLSIQEGMMQHSFGPDEEMQTAFRFQNVILGSTKKATSYFYLPKNTKLKFGLITLFKTNFEPSHNFRGQLPVLLNNIFKGFAGKHRYTYFGDISDRDSAYLSKIFKLSNHRLEDRLNVEAAVYHLLASKLKDHDQDQSKEARKDELTQTEISSLLKLSEYISRNLDKTLKIKELERESGLNQKRIQYGFQQFFGFSVNKYIVNLRILKAKELLENTDLSISEIVFKIGLSSRSYFSRIFSEKYGILPKEYKSNLHLSNPTFELCYYSTASKNLKHDDFRDILHEANKFNEKHSITGCLIYHEGYFMQLLEGNKDHVESIYQQIKLDKRHSNLKIMFTGFKSGRIFDEWSMAFIEEPSVFSMNNLKDFKLLSVDMLRMLDKTSKSKQDNILQTKLMWESARNTLILEAENHTQIAI
ncbi:BLUF domain-containing protein [Galbibacter mesophilus]|uniref:BLUF domain-containing protein n=1 Tax=Galbibacter mesophilus TaxID=379069 RepID=UPI00191E4919|nr:BLUF domain-containing protein [Galbibacter mesophilus]MCM5662797.1 BLUF domain-containing protein [Galbibacter mesophilus]